MSRRRFVAARLRDERGYTLIELLLASAAGLVVSAAAMAIVIAALTLSINDGDRTDSDQQAGVAMESIVQALNSSCVLGVGVSSVIGATGGTGLTGSTAVQPSSGDTLSFYSSQTDTPAITNPSEVEVYLTATNGPLDMATYQYSAASNGYSATPSSQRVLVPHAAPPGSTGSTGSTTPIFTYFGYDPTSGTLSDQFSSSPSLGATNAANTAEVGISFQSQPSDGNNPGGAAVDLSNSVVLRITAEADSPTSSTGLTGVSPCA
jgi:prepilin-type N-terminal cleavage/methylation domain-containing protein